MKYSNLEAMAKVVPHLGPPVKYALLGGAIVELLITEKPITAVRPTDDVDAIIEAACYGEFSNLEEVLRLRHFQHDTTEGAPICRWTFDGIIVDLMPSDEKILGWGTRWFKEAVKHAVDITIGDGIVAKVVTAPYFIGTKLEAFRERGKKDFIMSRDIEDIIVTVNGRPELAGEIARSSTELRDYLKAAFKALMEDPDFMEALPGHLPPGQSSVHRLAILTQRLNGLAVL